MKSTLTLLALALSVLVGCDSAVQNRLRQSHEVKITIPSPDPRVTELEARVKALEKWAQRQGMKY